MSSDTRQRLSARITGRVQGVGFRHFTTVNARRLRLDGWVRNEPDGSVRIEAEGPKDALDDLVEAVHRGPRAARVDDVDIAWDAPSNAFDGFHVRYH